MKLKVNAPLDPGFMPMSVIYRDFEAAVQAEGGEKLVIGLERNNGLTSVFTLEVFKDGTGHDEENHDFVERIVKTLLWARGGYKIIIAGSKVIADRIKEDYTASGIRAFDSKFMSEVYERPFEVIHTSIENAPVTNEKAAPVGRHLDGCRIGFDAGGSDRKVSAVVEGEAVYSEEVVWFPKLNNDPTYHYEGIMDAMKTAASKMPKVDAIGVSTAGIVIENRIMTASLFLKVKNENPEAFEKVVKSIYTDIAKELGNVPIEVANDGDVTALAGAMDLGDTNVLGIAMGTSEAGGYVDGNGNITGWLNELAFVPADFNKGAMVDEWSGDYGCGVKYFSQDAVIKLAPAAGIELDAITGGAAVNQNRETRMSGVFSAGNVLHVHDLVDYVSEEAELAGRSAAEYVKNGAKKLVKSIEVGKAGGVRYVVPQRVDIYDENDDIKIYFRVGNIISNATLSVKCGDKVISSQKKRKMAPGEMEFVKVSRDVLNSAPDSLSVEISV